MFDKFSYFGVYWWVLPTIIYTFILIVGPILFTVYVLLPFIIDYKHDCKVIEKNMTLTKNPGELLVLQDKHKICLI